MSRLVLPLLCLAALGVGCTASVDTNPPPPPPPEPIATSQGQVVLDWSINGAKDPNLCYQSNAATLSVEIFDGFGQSAGTFAQDCTAFATTITLAPDNYTASALLLDGNGQPRTTAVPVNPFTIRGSDQLSIPIDFPSSSFY